MRQVKVFENKKIDGTFKMVERGVAIFHQFGVCYEEFESGPGNYSTAILEWPDGSVSSVPVEHIKFIAENERIIKECGE